MVKKYTRKNRNTKTRKNKKKLWKNIKAHSSKSRKNMKNKYGSKCFLDSKRMKYPICNKFNGKQECMGLHAADYYLNINIGKIVNKKKQQDKTKLNRKEKRDLTRKLDKYYKIKSKSDKFKKKICN